MEIGECQSLINIYKAYDLSEGKSFCDEKVDSNLIEEGKRLIDEARGKTFKGLRKNPLYTSFYYRSTDGKYELFYMIFNDRCDEESTIMGLVNIETKKFVFLGSDCGHPFINGSDFCYCHSDGDDPNVSVDVSEDEERNPKLILTDLRKLYKSFSSLGDRD